MNMTFKAYLRLAVIVCLFAAATAGQKVSNVWQPDNGDGTYTNPIIHADYSDPDVVRVGDDFYMTASSFNAAPGLPILHSRDLVNWSLINHAVKRQLPENIFDTPQHGNGIWAPSIRYHKGEFLIYWGDPDQGVFMTKAKDPRGVWSPPLLIKAAKGWIDTSPLWDDDGNAYLVHAFAGSRAGIKSILVVNKMTPEGTEILDDGVMIFDGHDEHPTVEGPKFHKINGYYYVSAPAGGVATGWQIVMRSRNIYGPYETKIVLAQGKTDINGPHQGALVDTPLGEWWFVHFQDKGAYGRIVHLQPTVWKNGFPVIGSDVDGDGIGEPVKTFRKPKIKIETKAVNPADSDEFSSSRIEPQWQWHANPVSTWAFPFPERGVLKMFSVQTPPNYKNLWDLPNLLLQKFPAEQFTATAKVEVNSRFDGERFGLVVMGLDHSMLAVTNRAGNLFLSQATAGDADKGTAETESTPFQISSKTMFLRVKVLKDAICEFSYSIDGKRFTPVGTPFKAREGKWIGAKLGFVFTRPGVFNDGGSADIDWIRFEK